MIGNRNELLDCLGNLNLDSAFKFYPCFILLTFLIKFLEMGLSFMEFAVTPVTMPV